MRLIAFFVTLLSGFAAFADTPVSNPTPPEAPVAIAPQQPEKPSTLDQVSTFWRQALQGMKSNDLKVVNDAVLEVERLRTHAGYRSTEDYSLALIRAGEVALTKGKLDEAAFYTRWAVRLSPDSPRVLLDSAPMVYYTGVGSGFANVWTALTHLPSSPVLCITLVTKSIYPVLLAITIAAYLILVLYIVFWISDILRGMAGYFSPYIRGLATPLATVGLLAAPLSFGPLICAVAWSLVLWISDRRRRWPCFVTGTLLIMWSVIAPVREKLLQWSEIPGTQVILDVTSGTLGGIDTFELEKHVQSAPDDGAAWYVLAQLKRKAGRYSEAVSALTRADKYLPGNTSVSVELATVSALQGDLARARQLLDDAGKAGESSAEFYFNRSKIEMAQLDMGAARTSLLEAQRLDPELVRGLKAREDSIGSDSAVTYADPRLSMWDLFNTFSTTEVPEGDAAARALLPGFSGKTAGGLGLALILAGLIPISSRRSRRVSPYYAEYVPNNIALTIMRLVPGGEWVVENKPVKGLAILSVAVLAAMPLAAWPADARSVLEHLPNVAASYTVIFAIVLLGLVSWGLVRGER